MPFRWMSSEAIARRRQRLWPGTCPISRETNTSTHSQLHPPLEASGGDDEGRLEDERAPDAEYEEAEVMHRATVLGYANAATQRCQNRADSECATVLELLEARAVQDRLDG